MIRGRWPSRADKAGAPKGDRARLLAMALAVLLLRGGERVGLIGRRASAARGPVADRPAGAGASDRRRGGARTTARPMRRAGGAWRGRCSSRTSSATLSAVEAALAQAVGQGRAAARSLQMLDPAEEAFPFDGRTIFESMGGSLRHETLRPRATARPLPSAAGRAEGAAGRSAPRLGWHVQSHHTGDSAQAALLWLYRGAGAAR